MSERALEAAAEALRNNGPFGDLDPEEDARAAVAAYLDALLEELPEEAVEAASEVVGNRGDGVFAKTVTQPMLDAFLRSLRQGAG